MNRKVLYIAGVVMAVGMLMCLNLGVNKVDSSNSESHIVTSRLSYSDAMGQGKIVYGKASYDYDTDNLSAQVGVVDNVFVGRVISDEGNFNASDIAKSPFTKFKVKVLKNIKGELSTAKPIIVYKDGGMLETGEFYLTEGDVFPEKGNYYVFSASVVDSGDVLPIGALRSGLPGSTVLLDKEEAKAMKSEKIREFEHAIDTEIPYQRKRVEISESEVYTD
jgi:hypothetical protein